MSASHGSTPAAWTAVGIMFLGFLVAGIVADSDPAAEDEECLNKAMAVLRAVATAGTLHPVP